VLPTESERLRELTNPLAATAAAARLVSPRPPGSEAASLAPSENGEDQMKAGRKNLRRACDEGAAVTLAEGESIMQVLTLRGSNVIEVGGSYYWTLPGLPAVVLTTDGSPHRRSALLLGDGRRGRQVPGPVPSQVPEELLDQER
jgi:hypothetical protein